MSPIVVVEENPAYPELHQLAERNSWPLVSPAKVQAPFSLRYQDEQLCLVDSENGNLLAVDFLSGTLDYRRQSSLGKNQLLFKALGYKNSASPPTVLDATAGLGVDAFLMACMGCHVTALERSPIVYALLQDGYARALHTARENEYDKLISFLRALNFVHADALEHLGQIKDREKTDVIYLDPMYPESKKSALPKKGMQVFRKLLGADPDVAELLALARTKALSRVVLKRPLHAPVTGEPSHSFVGKTVRYDMYLVG
jgi:16S rRNA (guanine1516-N2)-methyltransferase